MKGVAVATIEELAERITGKALREEARKRGIRSSCVKKVDIARKLPRDVLERLASEPK